MKTIRGEADSKWALSCCSPLTNHNHQKATSSTLPGSYLPTYKSSARETRPGRLKGLLGPGGVSEQHSWCAERREEHVQNHSGYSLKCNWEPICMGAAFSWPKIP